MIAKRLYEIAETHTDRPAIALAGQTLTYRELFQETARFISSIHPYIKELEQMAIGLLAERSLPNYVAILSTALAGWTYVPLNPDYPDERLRKIIDTAEIGVLVVDAERVEAAERIVTMLAKPILVVVADSTIEERLRNVSESLAEATHTILNYVDIGQERTFTHEDLQALSGQHHKPDPGPLYIMFTSGTTGEPKGIRISQENLNSYLDAIEQLFDFNHTDRFSQFFNSSFDLSVHDMFVCWTVGGCLHVPTRMEIFDPVKFARQNRLTVWFSVPSLAALTMRFGKLLPDSLPDLRHALFCGEALSWATASAFGKAAPAAIRTNLYGPTEATIAITHYQLPVGDSNGGAGGDAESGLDAVSIGEPFPTQESIILNENLQPVAHGETGELFLGGSQLADGYFKNPHKTAEKFVTVQVDGCENQIWYRTGDLAERSQHDGILFKGRTDDQIKLHGHRIELTEVEEALRRSAETALAIVAPWPTHQAGNADQLVAFVCQSQCPLEQLRGNMADLLPKYMLPSKFIPIEQPYFNVNHKLDRRRIVEQYGNLVDAS